MRVCAFGINAVPAGSCRFQPHKWAHSVLFAVLVATFGGCGERSPSRPASQGSAPSPVPASSSELSKSATDTERALWRASVTSEERSALDTMTDESERDFYGRSWSLLARLSAGDKTVDPKSQIESLLEYVGQVPGKPADAKQLWTNAESKRIEYGGVALSTVAKVWALYGPLPQIEDKALAAIEQTSGNKDEFIRLCRAWAAWSIANVRGSGPRSARADALAAECLDDDYVESTLPIQLERLRAEAKANGTTLPPNPPPRAR